MSAAASAARAVGITAATDVTGFSLLGHAIEMAEGAGLGLEIDVSALPVLSGAWDTLRQGIAPGATRRNLAHFGARVTWADGVSDEEQKLLGDPQTSGGLLFAVEPSKAAALVEALDGAGAPASAVVGKLTDSGWRVNKS